MIDSSSFITCVVFFLSLLYSRKKYIKNTLRFSFYYYYSLCSIFFKYLFSFHNQHMMVMFNEEKKRRWVKKKILKSNIHCILEVLSHLPHVIDWNLVFVGIVFSSPGQFCQQFSIPFPKKQTNKQRSCFR